MSYKILDHATDVIIEVTASNLNEAFSVAGQSVVDTTLNSKYVNDIKECNITVTGKNLQYLLFNWLEAIIYQLITEGFAISRIKARVSKNFEYTIQATIFGESIDLKKHGFKVEIKAPTFHEMEITQTKNIKMKFLLDL